MPGSNFTFLQGQWPAIYETALQAEESALCAPRTSAFYARYSLERTINLIFDIDLTLTHVLTRIHFQQ
jgi:type I restriction enzyme R subunit